MTTPADPSTAIERLIATLTKRLVADGCDGDDEQGCTRDDDDVPLKQWCTNCLAGRLIQALASETQARQDEKTRHAERDSARTQTGLWKEAAYKKIRTWDSLQSMHRAGDTVDELAKDFGVPVEWMTFVMFPENDLDARYARRSDRTKTAKADRLAALIELRDVKAERFRLFSQIERAEAQLTASERARAQAETERDEARESARTLANQLERRASGKDPLHQRLIEAETEREALRTALKTLVEILDEAGRRLDTGASPKETTWARSVSASMDIARAALSTAQARETTAAAPSAQTPPPSDT